MVLINETITLQEKSFLVHIHQPYSTIDRQDENNNIKRKMSKRNINEMPYKVVGKEIF